MDSGNIEQQAQYIWNRLDDLASTDPNAYKKFIDEQMKEREVYISAPEPKLCVLVKIKDDSRSLYVNVCAWKRIPYPEDDEEPLKLMCGFRQLHRSSGSSTFITVPVAVNDKVLDEMLKSSLDKFELIKLILQLVTHKQKIKLEDKFEICKDLYKGDVPADPRRLFDKNPQFDYSEATLNELIKGPKTSKDVISTPETLLKSMNDDYVNSSEPDFVKNFMNKKNDSSKKLVQEIGKTIREPEHELYENEASFVLKIKLPQVESSAQCDLDISQNAVELLVPELYNLQVDLSKPVDENQAKAKFNKKSFLLTLTMPKLN